MVATVLARSPGARKVTGVTSVPNPMPVVIPARKPSVVVLSGRSSHTLPTWGICRRWSMTHRPSNPACSAVTAAAARWSASRGRAALPCKARDLQAEPKRLGVLRLTARRLVGCPEPREHESDRARSEYTVP